MYNIDNNTCYIRFFYSCYKDPTSRTTIYNQIVNSATHKNTLKFGDTPLPDSLLCGGKFLFAFVDICFCFLVVAVVSYTLALVLSRRDQ